MVSLATKGQRQREARVDHARQRQRPAHGIFSRGWNQWAGATLKVELAGEPAFIAKLRNVDLNASTATLHQVDQSGELIGVRELPWPPDGKVTVLRTPSGIGQHTSTGARGNTSN
jgi:hypothetical protein